MAKVIWVTGEFIGCMAGFCLLFVCCCVSSFSVGWGWEGRGVVRVSLISMLPVSRYSCISRDSDYVSVLWIYMNLNTLQPTIFWFGKWVEGESSRNVSTMFLVALQRFIVFVMVIKNMWFFSDKYYISMFLWEHQLWPNGYWWVCFWETVDENKRHNHHMASLGIYENAFKNKLQSKKPLNMISVQNDVMYDMTRMTRHARNITV